MTSFTHCPYCGSRYEDQPPTAEGFACWTCNRIFYPQLKLGAAGILEKDGNVLLLKRSRDPFAEAWSLPAGYVAHHESPMQTVQREVHEECSLQVVAEELFGAYFFDDDPRGNGVLLVYRCVVVRGELQLNEEANEGGYFPADNLPKPLAGAGHDQAIMAWQRGR